MLQLRSEFVGGSSPFSFSSLYQNAPSTYTVAVDGIPNTGVPLQASKFYGKAKVQNYNNLILFLDGKNTSSYPGSGVTWNDLSSKGNSVTLNGNGYTSLGNGAITFNGSTTYLYRSTFNGMTSTFTAIYYIYVISADGVIAQLNRSPSSADQEYVLGVNYFWDYDSGFGYNTANPSTYITSVGWYQVAFVKNGTSATWYLNGNANGMAYSSKNAFYGPTAFCIGKDFRDNVGFFNGYLGFMMMYNYSLSAAEISTNYANYRSRYGL